MIQAVTWTVVETGGGSITSAGLYTAPAVAGSFHVKAVAVADNTASSLATVTVNPPVVTPPGNPSGDGSHFIHLMSPNPGQQFLAPGFVRVFVSASDLNNWRNQNRAASVDIMVDDTVQTTIPGNQSENIVYKTNLSGIAAGAHRIWARGHFVDGKTFDSEQALISVDTPPAYAQVVNLTANVALSGTTNYELIGSPNARIRLNGNGFTITSNSSWKGRLTLKYVDIVNAGVLASATPGVKVTTTGAVDIEYCIFDSTQALDLTVQATAPAILRANEFRSNMYMNVASQPINTGTGTQRTGPVIRLQGTSTAQHFFQGNNVGLSTIEVVNAKNWLFGGSTDADANVFIGPRVGIELENGSGMQIRRNISDQLYFGGWSQGNNFEMNSGPDLVVEQNLISGGSWPVRGIGGIFRYNLVLNADEDWLWISEDNAQVHHNIFAEGASSRAGVFVIYGPKGVQFTNNTLDGFGLNQNQVPLLVDDGATGNFSSNVFYRFHGTPILGTSGTVTANANYNLFDNPGVSSIHNYQDNRHPAQDIGALNAQVDPKFVTPTPPRYTSISRADIWKRALTLKQILAAYRGYYTPGAGSPLTDAGDPAGGAGNDIGAIGSGAANTADQFGVLDGGAPAPVSVFVSPNATTLNTSATQAFSATVFGSANQTVTWSVVEANGGSITGAGIYSAPAIAGTYHVKAIAAADTNASAQATITVNAPVVPVGVRISPSPVSVTTGATQPFSATVTGSTNQTVTWSVVETAGGSITTAGVYTAPATAGTFHVKAVAAADTTASAQVTITVNAPAVPVPVITSFTASPRFLSEPGPVTLSWNVTGADSLAISPAIGAVTGTSIPVTVSATTTYTLTATNASGQAIAATSVTVGTVTGSVTHPRIWLTPASLASLRSRAAANDAAWVSLRAACDALTHQPVEFPDGTGGGNNAIAGGYQYFDY
ncbi:MAG TPA: right-handed parallel beta-helix repeat-containing protein, partial [Candidatus Didemnitutus sp.]|nr:right-handed parallel beta-helix repeat-containing protein [Candidatus Didemnitutus sp.]